MDSSQKNIDFEKLETALKSIEEAAKQASAVIQDIKLCQSDVSKTVLASVVKKKVKTMLPDLQTVTAVCSASEG